MGLYYWTWITLFCRALQVAAAPFSGPLVATVGGTAAHAQVLRALASCDREERQCAPPAIAYVGAPDPGPGLPEVRGRPRLRVRGRPMQGRVQIERRSHRRVRARA